MSKDNGVPVEEAVITVGKVKINEFTFLAAYISADGDCAKVVTELKLPKTRVNRNGDEVEVANDVSAAISNYKDRTKKNALAELPKNASDADKQKVEKAVVSRLDKRFPARTDVKVRGRRSSDPLEMLAALEAL